MATTFSMAFAVGKEITVLLLLIAFAREISGNDEKQSGSQPKQRQQAQQKLKPHIIIVLADLSGLRDMFLVVEIR
ncbi:hypothetical protein BIW11_05027, partial [Tropilaelaps mercedesae]